MKKKRLAIEQITEILKQAELGIPVADLFQEGRKHAIRSIAKQYLRISSF